MNRRSAVAAWFRCATALAALILMAASTYAPGQQGTPNSAPSSAAIWVDDGEDCGTAAMGSPYIPVDSWIYPAVIRLYALGFIDTVYLGMRPWTRASVSHMLEDAGDRLEDDNYVGAGADEAEGLYDSLKRELRDDDTDPCHAPKAIARSESAYTVVRAISGTPLRDSYHLGSTIINDYGRPYASGFNNYTGASGYATAGRFALYLRGEFQGAPSAAGYSASLAEALSTVDGTAYLNSATGTPYNQTTIPMGPTSTATQGRFLEAYLSAEYAHHVISFGKQDDWLGPGMGGGMAYSNNAENIYSFRINRIEPLTIPFLSRLTGPFRYEFLIGSLRGHTQMANPLYVANPSPGLPNVLNAGDPWVHVEKISFRPTENLEFGFERTVICGGEGHSPVTFRTFIKSFFSTASPNGTDKFTSADPGARFCAFDFSYRLPFVRNWFTVYTDSEVHDEVNPIDAPRRASFRPGLYLSHVPGLRRLDIRAEAVSTDPRAATPFQVEYGQFMYTEFIEKQGYTNQGQMFGDWIGREDKGGQGWITYHLSGNEYIQVGVRNQKASKNFIPGSTTQTFTGSSCDLNDTNALVGESTTTCLVPGGTTLNDIDCKVVKRIAKDLEIKGSFALEHYKAPVYVPGQQTVTTTTIQVTWFPGRKVTF